MIGPRTPFVRRRGSSPRTGFTLFEVTITTVVLVVGLLGLCSTRLVVARLRESERERTLAMQAMRTHVERVKARSVAALDSSDGWAATFVEAYTEGGEHERSFPHEGLAPWDGEDAVVTVSVVTDETLTDLEIGAQLGMPRDLDGDGLVADSDVSGSAALLPVVVRVRWAGNGGELEASQGFYLLGF